MKLSEKAKKVWKEHSQLVVLGGIVAVAAGVGVVIFHKPAPKTSGGLTAMAATTNPSKVGMFVSTDGTGNAGTWVAVSGAGTPFTGTVQPIGLSVSVDGSGNPGTWAAAGPTTFASSGAPSWLQYMGDGSDGAYSCTSGTCATITGEHWYSSLNISAGAITPAAPTGISMIIRVTGACTIAGTLSYSQVSGASGQNVNNSNFSAGGGGGGGGTAAGGAGGSALWANQYGGAAGAAGGGVGGPGGVVPNTTYRMFVLSQLSPSFSPNLQSGTYAYIGGAAGGGGGSSGGQGGFGGGFIVLVCGSINFTGTIDVRGGGGSPSTGNGVGPGGGGGGGIAIVRSPVWTANTGTIQTAGGPGGTCGASTTCGAGGAGGAGWSYVATQ